MSGDVRFYREKVIARMREGGEQALRKLAFDIEARVKLKIADNDQIDTGAMLNSAYTVNQEGSSYGQAQAAVEAKRPGVVAPEAQLPSDAAAGVVVSVNYAIYQENRKSFLFAGAEEVCREAGGTCAEVMRKVVHD
jgi:hypothetical protein